MYTPCFNYIATYIYMLCFRYVNMLCNPGNVSLPKKPCKPVTNMLLTFRIFVMFLYQIVYCDGSQYADDLADN